MGPRRKGRPVVDSAHTITIENNKYPGDDRPIFIGQAPSRHGDPTKPLTGRVGEKLAALASMVPMEFYLSVVRTNLLPYYVGTNGNGDAFPMPEARRNAFKMAPVLDGRTVVFVGRRVTEAFGYKADWFTWGKGYFAAEDKTVRIKYAAIPHPSGRNRFWNDPTNVQEARAFMTELMKTESSLPLLRSLRERARAIGEKRLGRPASETPLRGTVSSGPGAGSLQEHHRGAGT